jgi:hypothetical protein
MLARFDAATVRELVGRRMLESGWRWEHTPQSMLVTIRRWLTMLRWWAVAAVIAVGLILVGTPAHADDAVVLVSDSDYVQLTIGDDRVLAATVTLANDSAAEVVPSVMMGAGAPADCSVSTSGAGLARTVSWRFDSRSPAARSTPSCRSSCRPTA